MVSDTHKKVKTGGSGCVSPWTLSQRIGASHHPAPDSVSLFISDASHVLGAGGNAETTLAAPPGGQVSTRLRRAWSVRHSESVSSDSVSEQGQEKK